MRWLEQHSNSNASAPTNSPDPYAARLLAGIALRGSMHLHELYSVRAETYSSKLRKRVRELDAFRSSFLAIQPVCLPARPLAEQCCHYGVP